MAWKTKGILCLVLAVTAQEAFDEFRFTVDRIVRCYVNLILHQKGLILLKIFFTIAGGNKDNACQSYATQYVANRVS